MEKYYILLGFNEMDFRGNTQYTPVYYVESLEGLWNVRGTKRGNSMSGYIQLMVWGISRDLQEVKDMGYLPYEI